MLNILAGMVESEAGGNATDTFEERVKIAQAQRTPTKRAGETNETMAAREERESAEVAFAKAMSVLTPEQREVFARATHFLDPMTRLIETKAEGEQRMACWSKFAMPSLRSHHQELASNVMEGDFAALIGKVMRDKSEAIVHSKESLLRDMDEVVGNGLTIEELLDEFTKIRFKHKRVFGTEMDADLVKPKILRCAEKRGEDYARKISDWRMDGNHLKWDYDKLKLRLQFIEAEQAVKERESAAAGGGAARQGRSGAARSKQTNSDSRASMDCYSGKDCNKIDCPYKHPTDRGGPAGKKGKKEKGQGKGYKNTECFTCGETGHISRDCPLRPSKEELEARRAAARRAIVPPEGAATSSQETNASEQEEGRHRRRGRGRQEQRAPRSYRSLKR